MIKGKLACCIWGKFADNFHISCQETEEGIVVCLLRFLNCKDWPIERYDFLKYTLILIINVFTISNLPFIKDKVLIISYCSFTFSILKLKKQMSLNKRSFLTLNHKIYFYITNLVFLY